MELTGKTALVTGSARRLGKAIALQLASGGAEIALHYNHSADAAAQTAAEITDIGSKVELFQADLSDPEQIADMFTSIARKMGKLDLLVNNAAVFHRTPLETLTAQQWDAEFAINARAPALCIHHALELMSEGGAIINILDIGAEKARAGFPAYSASKGALLALTRSAAKALAPKIRVNAVSPGASMWAEDTTEDEKQTVLAQVPMAREGTAFDVAAAVVFLAKQDYITGQNIRVDGGWHMG